MTSTNSVALGVELGLRSIGIWPDMSYMWLYRCAWILTTSIVQTCQYWYIIIHVKTDDLSHLMDGLSVTVEYSMMFLKFIILWLNSRILHDVLATMATDWREAAAVNEVRTMTSKANLSRRFAHAIIGIHSAACFFYGIGVLVACNEEAYDEDGKLVREFTLKMQLPFECNESPLHELVMCLEFLHQLAASAVTGTLNSLIVTLILHISGQIDILCDALRAISPESSNQQGLTISVARKLIGRHHKIIAFSNEIERVFCYIALAQFFSSTLVICCLGFLIVMSISDMQDTGIDTSLMMKALVFYMAATVEAFVFCFCGEYLSAKSKTIGDAAYKSLWYNLRPSESKIVLLIILRSQKRLTITAGKIMDLSLEGFTSIIKASVSYISVLHAMK